MHKTNVGYACGQMNYPLGSRISTAITTVRKNSSGSQCSVPSTTMSDRKNAKSSIFIKRPYISVIGTIQKKILNELAKGERSSNGFIDRILFVMPNLQQKARWNDKELPEDIEQEWNDVIAKLIQSECNLNEHGEIEPANSLLLRRCQETALRVAAPFL